LIGVGARPFRRSAALIAAACICAAVLSSCVGSDQLGLVQYEPGYVTRDGGRFTLRSRCPEGFVRVAAIYDDEASRVDQQPADPRLLWDARVTDPAVTAAEVVLFGDSSAGLQVVTAAPTVDAQRAMTIGYSTRGSGAVRDHEWNGVSLKLAELKDGQVAWAKGIADAGDFLGMAGHSFRCG